MTIAPLAPEQLHIGTDPQWLDFATTQDLPTTGGALGQEIAVQSLEFGLSMAHRGYNLFAYGEEGTGRRSLILELLETRAKARPVPFDTVYLCNFAKPQQPICLRLPVGMGPKLKKDLEWLVEELEDALPAALEDKEHRAHIRAFEMDLDHRREDALDQLFDAARAENVLMRSTEQGFEIKPLMDGTIMDQATFEAMPDEEQERFEVLMQSYQHALEEILGMFPAWERETKAHVRDAEQEVTINVANQLLSEFRDKYADIPELVDYFHQLTTDVADLMELFVSSASSSSDDDSDDEEDEDSPRLRRIKQSQAQRRYSANVLVCHEGKDAAPVVYEDNPTHNNLFGRVEYQSLFGVVSTDFTLIKPGALHRANGGYLLLDARRVLNSPFVWEDLKRVLRSRRLGLEPMGQATTQAIGQSLEPECTALDIKIIMVGDPSLYYLLCNEDPEFSELFKVAADFGDTMKRNQENTKAIALSLASLVTKEGLRHLDASAVGRVVEHASRMADDAHLLSTHQASIADLVRESDYWAAQDSSQIISLNHVNQALNAARSRLGRIGQESLDDMLNEIVHIPTSGSVVGQINGLAVLEIGHFAFGRPSRISAQVHVGRGDVVDIEREVDLGGPLHGKGVLILTAFFAGRFGQNQALSLAANLVFEQSYGGVDGDSASSTELYALLSSLAQVPIRQGLAVTGSVDQFGRVQAIGGVNEKIEGFFALCNARGLDGSQGVIIPKSNIRHLMLNQDVVQAVRNGLFNIYAISHVDEGIEILTGIPAGQADAQGTWPAGSINRKVELRLAAFAKASEDSGQTQDRRRR